jgi:hypothetical protein
MTLATGTLGAPTTMTDEPLNQRPAHDLAADWQSVNQSGAPLDELFLFHLYQ